MFRKVFQTTFSKAADDGTVEAIIATLNVKDKDGDVTLPGFFGTQEIVMLPAHDWQHIPLGKGILSEDGNRAIARFTMNLEIESAREWHSALKFDLAKGKPLQQWSYGFDILDGASKVGEFEGNTVRFLGPVNNAPGSKVFEASPVLVGAGEGTQTLSVKSADEEPQKLSDQAEAVRVAAVALAERGKSLADLRAKDGRSVSAESRERLASVAGALMDAAKALAALTVTTTNPALLKEYARFIKMGVEAQGNT